MTSEDLAQITAIVAAAEQRIAERMDRTISERMDRTMEALTTNLSDVRQELTVRIEQVAIRLDTVEHRLDSFGATLLSVDGRMTALLRQADRQERDIGAMLANSAAQQRAFDQLVARVAKIERELHPGQH